MLLHISETGLMTVSIGVTIHPVIILTLVAVASIRVHILPMCSLSQDVLPGWKKTDMCTEFCGETSF